MSFEVRVRLKRFHPVGHIHNGAMCNNSNRVHSYVPPWYGHRASNAGKLPHRQCCDRVEHDNYRKRYHKHQYEVEKVEHCRLVLQRNRKGRAGTNIERTMGPLLCIRIFASCYKAIGKATNWPKNCVKCYSFQVIFVTTGSIGARIIIARGMCL